MTDQLSPAQAMTAAQERLAEVEGRWRAIQDVVEPLFVSRQENNFATRIRAAIIMPREH